jgi:hypothetical protein
MEKNLVVATLERMFMGRFGSNAEAVFGNKFCIRGEVIRVSTPRSSDQWTILSYQCEDLLGGIFFGSV